MISRYLNRNLKTYFRLLPFKLMLFFSIVLMPLLVAAITGSVQFAYGIGGGVFFTFVLYKYRGYLSKGVRQSVEEVLLLKEETAKIDAELQYIKARHLENQMFEFEKRMKDLDLKKMRELEKQLELIKNILRIRNFLIENKKNDLSTGIISKLEVRIKDKNEALMLYNIILHKELIKFWTTTLNTSESPTTKRKDEFQRLMEMIDHPDFDKEKFKNYFDKYLE